MRLLPLLLTCTAFLGTANAAQIITSNLYIAIADGTPLDRILTAEELSVVGGIGATVNWGNWEGFGGGEMLIKLGAGESVTSATIYITEGISNARLCDLTFKANGEEAGTQLWTGFQQYGYWVPTFNYPGTTAPIYFEVTTNLGTFGKQFYIVPEPSSTMALCVGFAAMFCRRRRS